LSLMTEAANYGSAMASMRRAAVNDDQAAYAKEREKLLYSGLGQALYTAMSNVYLVTEDDQIKEKANRIGGVYFPVDYYPASIEGFDEKGAEKTITEGVKARNTFAAAARADVLKD
jgi:hypothetical protein